MIILFFVDQLSLHSLKTNMDNGQIKQKIIANTMALMPLKVDNEELVKYKFRAIRDQISDLRSPVPEESEIYLKAFNLIKAAINNEYKQFVESVNHDEKDLALIALKHKAAEACEILRSI